MLTFMKEDDDQSNVSQDDSSPVDASSGDVSGGSGQNSGQASGQIGGQVGDQIGGQVSSQISGQSKDDTAGDVAVESNSKNTVERVSLTKALSDDGDKSDSISDDYLVPASSGKKVKYGTLILGSVFLIGALSLFLAITKFGPKEVSAALSADELKIESAIARLTGSKAAINDKMNDIVDRISSLSKIEQVSVNELKCNPFQMDDSSTGVDISSFAGLDGSGVGLKLWSIMESKGVKSCMINDRIYHSGDRVGKFTVKNIRQGIVELAVGEKILVLRMSK